MIFVKKVVRAAVGLGLYLLISSGISAGEAQAEFTDTAGHWAETAIKWGAEQAILDGYADLTFQPDRTVSEAEFVAMLLRGFHVEVDANPGLIWSDSYYKAAQKYNMPVGGVAPIAERDKPISRTKVAEMVSGADGKHYMGADAVRFLLQMGYAQGKIDAAYAGTTVYGYRGEESLTRAEAVTFIKNLLEKGWTTLQVRPNAPSDPTQLTRLSGEKLEGYRTDRGQSGPVLYFTYEVDRGNVVFTNNKVSPDDPAYKVRLKEQFNPRINQLVYAIANSLYDPDQEKLTLLYSRKGVAAVSLLFGTYDQSLQTTGSPYFNRPFEFTVYEDVDDSQNKTVNLDLYRLWGNRTASVQFEDYYINKLRSALVSFLGESEGIQLCNALVEEMKILVQDQAKVQDWVLKMGDPELDYSRTGKVALSTMEAYIYTSISGIHVSFYTKADPQTKPSLYVVAPDGTYLVGSGQSVPYNHVLLETHMSIERKGAVVIRGSEEKVIRTETISTPYGPAIMEERQFAYADAPERGIQTQYLISLLLTVPGDPDTKLRYTLHGIVNGDKEGARQDMLDLVQGWRIPE